MNSKSIQGIIYKSTGSWYDVTLEDGNRIKARTKGKLKLQNIKSTNPIAVGDWVVMDIDGEDFIIKEILQRKNYIVRKSNNLSKQTHVIAANLDLACIVVSLINPRTSLGFIDRFLVCCEAYHIPVLIIYNKIDLYKDSALYNEVESLYHLIGYPSLSVSATQGIGIEELKKYIHNKTVLFAGHSGVGKSTLLNCLIPGEHQKTGKISDYSGKGTHTTTFAEMFDLSEGGKIIDTPGIRDFGIVNIDQVEMAQYFPEFQALMSACKFNNCTHIHEPGCAVLQAINENKINPSRYYNYLSMMRNEDVLD